MKTLTLLFVTLFTFIPLSLSADDYICTIDDTEADKSTFYCYDKGTGGGHVESVDPFLEESLRRHLIENGVTFYNPTEFVGHLAHPVQYMLNHHAGRAVNSCESVFSQVYYRLHEIDRFNVNHPTVARIRELADAMHEAGVCNVPVINGNYHNINIRNQDDVLQHFLCISNSESVFGRDNLGIGGRGPWGIHPMHNQRRGTRAHVDGRMTTLPRDGVCLGLQSTVRNSAGEEIRTNSRYRDPAVIRDNARCALILYQNNGGYRPWGTTSAWGSNRHCSSSNRQRINFERLIGSRACCTDACRRRNSH